MPNPNVTSPVFLAPPCSYITGGDLLFVSSICTRSWQ